MPKFTNDDNMEVKDLVGPGNFQFSAVRPDDLGSPDGYTVVTVVIDETGSVWEFREELLKTLKSIVSACKKSPRAESLLLRVVAFNTVIREIHGFKELYAINPDDYKDFDPDHMTALYDATDTSIEATLTYAKDLSDNDFDVNGAIYIITDGYDNSSMRTPAMIAQRINEARKDEYIESLIVVLVGLTADETTNGYLEVFKNEGNLTQYVPVGDATPQKLAKLVHFVSQSISNQSQALKSGSASQPTNF